MGLGDELLPKYNYNLNTYKYPPRNYTTLSDLKKLCLERMVLYRIMVEAEYFNLAPNTEMWHDYLIKEITNKNLLTYKLLLKKDAVVGTFKARRCDHLAHWILSLCYCRTREKRFFFVKYELLWIMCLYKIIRKSDLNQFLQENDILPENVSVMEKIHLGCDFLANSEVPVEKVFETEFYKTRFQNIYVLLKSRKASLDSGIAYFSELHLIYYILIKLERLFSEQLEWNSKMLPNIEFSDPRLHDFLTEDLPAFVHTLNDQKISNINLQNIDDIANNHYPLCMQNIHNILRNNHHLKYDCKMQYGIFLKCLGLPYQDALFFWKTEFTKNMSEDWYTRKYEYLFKHQYGMVGGRIQYQPSACKDILRYQPGPLQHHGCPFKHWDKNRLLEKIKSDNLGIGHIRDIEDLVENKKYQLACTKYFCAKNNICKEDAIQSPNQYCWESLESDNNLNNLFETIFDHL